MHGNAVRSILPVGLSPADTSVEAVAYREFAALVLKDLCKVVVKGGAFIAVKAALDPRPLRSAGCRVWRL